MPDDKKLKDLYKLGREIDTGAEGHYARVYEAKSSLHTNSVAFKIMRHDFLSATTQPNGEIRNHDREWQAFCIEARALKSFSEHPMVTDFVDCGFINTLVDDDPDYPEPDDELISLGTNTDKFLEMISDQRKRKWRPYIVTEYVERRNAAIFIISEDVIGKRFPTHVVLEIISQFVDLLIYVQEKGFIYGDHKIAHTYWVFQDGKLKVIDWNGGKFTDEDDEYTPDQLRKEDVRDLVLKVMYSLLTGQRPIEKGVRPEGGWTGQTTHVDLPFDLAGRNLIQPFFDSACNWEFRDARHLRIKLDDLMIEYGMERLSRNAAESASVAGKAEIITLIKQLDKVLSNLQTIRDTAFENIDTRYPPHIRDEFQSIYRSISRILEANDLFTKIDFMG